MRNREAIQPRQIQLVVVDVLPYTADNNGDIVNARYRESATGVHRAWRVYHSYIKHTWENS